jgi:CBS-domain-containing membrane protein
MQAVDVMTPNVISVSIGAEVQEIANLLVEHGISAVPVVDSDDQVLGIVSESDLMRRVESQGDSHKSWWLKWLSGKDPVDYVKSHGRKASEIMTPDPITIEEEEPLYSIAALLEKYEIKRVPVVRDGKLVGIVSRADLLRGFSVTATDAPVPTDDREIREAVIKEIDDNTGVLAYRINVIVTDGEVQLWGLVSGHDEKMAAQVAAENIPGVKSVDNRLGITPRGLSEF